MIDLTLVCRWARALIVPAVVVWVVFLIGFDIVATALASRTEPASDTVKSAPCRTMPDGTRVCDFAPPGRSKSI